MYMPLFVALVFGIAIGIGLNRKYGSKHDNICTNK